MKIALYLPGHMRTYKQTLNSYTKLTTKYDVDVYISTWNVIDTNDNTYIDINEIIKKYYNVGFKNVFIDIENFDLKMFDKSIKFVYYKLYKTNLLRLNKNIKYDVIIRSRPDIYLFKDYDYNIYKQGLYLQYANLNDITCIHNDRFFFGDENSMNMISNLFLDINDLHDDILKHPHGIIYYYSKIKNINNIIFDKENTYEIVRK